MPTEHEASIIRFFTTEGLVVGTGFLVSEDTVLTCAHVVAAALWMPEGECPPDKPAAEIRLDFPLVAPNSVRTAHVLDWHPIQPNGGGDIAVLRLDDRPPEGIKMARLVATQEDLWGHDFRAYGFPDYHDKGVWASGKLRAREATGWVQIEDVIGTSFRVQPGFSGGAVWDEQLDGVAGMVVSSEKDVTNRAAYIIPTDVLVKAWPPLGQQTIPSCPYRGLSAFREEDEQYFFGREAFTQQLVDAARRKPLLAVVGASGSGKSSVVFAGLIPRLRKQGSWLIASFRPGNDPFRSLAVAFMPLLEPQMSELDRRSEGNKLARLLQQGELTFSDVVEMIAQKHSGTRLLLVADQFEELYTLCQDQEMRQRFLDELLAAVHTFSDQGTLGFNLVLTLRADFVAQALSHRPFADALQSASQMLGPMNTKELQDTIRRPAEKLHVRIEDGLTERMLKEVSREPSHLPLLEFALTLLWAKQQNSKLTNAAYEEIGGVEKALADHAEEVYTALSEEQQLRAQRIFVQLVRPGEGTEDTRRLATRTEVGEDNWELVMRLSSARLVVTGRDATTGEETVEVIHEALIRGWQRLREWIGENREFRTWQERLRAALRQWKSRGQNTGMLLPSILLPEAVRWLTQRPNAISEEEKVFIQASVAERDRQQAEERARQARELASQQQALVSQQQVLESQDRAKKRQRWVIVLLAVISVLLVLGSVGTLVFQGNLLTTQGNLLKTQKNFLTAQSKLLNSLPVSVTNLNDHGPASLREAIKNAHSGDEITFARNLGGTILLTSGELKITTDLAIIGPGASVLAISGGNTTRVFNVSSGLIVNISNVTIRDGFTMQRSTEFSEGLGGGIYNDFLSTLTLVNVIITNNGADFGGGIYNHLGTLTLTNSTISHNTVRGDGGGIDNEGTMTLTKSTVSGNNAAQDGGGIKNRDTLILTNSTISGNTASGNIATTGYGGGILNDGGVIDITYCTIYGNTAQAGGGIANKTTNEPGIEMIASIVAGDNANSDPDILGIITLYWPSLIQNASGTIFFSGPVPQELQVVFELGKHSIIGKSPNVGPLQNNGGLTQTHALLPGSPAIDQILPNDTDQLCGSNASNSTDQRGVTRPQGAGCDIGAYEYVLPK